MLKALNWRDGEIHEKRQLLAAYFLLAIETGMRLGEIVGIDAGDVFLKKRYVHLTETKNSDSRDVPLSKSAVKLMRLILAVDFSLGVESASSMFRVARKKAGIDDLTFHDSRHEACSQLAKIYDVLTLAKIIGHRDLKSLMVYYNPTATELAEKMDR